MSLFGIGGSSSSSRSQSQSNSYGYSGSLSSDISRSMQEGISGGQSKQSIAFSDIFSQLYGGALDATKRASLSGPMLADTAQMLFTGGTKFLDNLGADAGSDYLQSRVDGSNPVLDEQIGALREDVGRLFTEQLNPAITSRAIAGGTLGGGRQGVAQGLAIDAAGREFTRGVTELRANDINQRDQAAMAIAQNSLESASTGLGSLPMLLDLQTQRANSEFAPYSALASILGGPTVLSESSDFSRTTAQSFADAFSRAFGEQFATSSSSSKGKSKSFSLDIGPG